MAKRPVPLRAGFFIFIWAPGWLRSGRRRRANARGGWPDVGMGLLTPPAPRRSRGAGAIVDFQSDTSGHPPGALCAPRRRHVAVFGTTERPCRPRFLTALQHLLQRPGARRAVRSNAARARPVFVNPAPWSLALRAPATGTKNSACPSPHNRSHPWRNNKVRAINRASTMKHPALIGISGFMLVYYCKH